MSFLLDAIVMQRARDARRELVEVGDGVVVPHVCRQIARWLTELHPVRGPNLADLIAGPTPRLPPHYPGSALGAPPLSATVCGLLLPPTPADSKSYTRTRAHAESARLAAAPSRRPLALEHTMNPLSVR